MSSPVPRHLRDLWTSAVLLPGERDLRASCLRELSEYTSSTREEVLARIERAREDQRREWSREDRSTREKLIDFYARSDAYLYESLWWHALQRGEAPAWNGKLAQLAGKLPLRRYLDFGGGIGTNAILLGRLGLEVAVADVSGVLLDFARWRLRRRGLDAALIDLRRESLKPLHYDLISAVDVLEHVKDPLETLEELHAALAPSGILVINLIASPPDPERPFHLMRSKYPIRSRIRGLGFRILEGFQKYLVLRKTGRSGPAARLVRWWDIARWRLYYLAQGKWPEG